MQAISLMQEAAIIHCPWEIEDFKKSKKSRQTHHNQKVWHKWSWDRRKNIFSTKYQSLADMLWAKN
jgi:hypothetical protein